MNTQKRSWKIQESKSSKDQKSVIIVKYNENIIINLIKPKKRVFKEDKENILL